MTNARIEVITPGGFEEFFRSFVDMTDVGPRTSPAVAALGEDYGLPFAQPEWLADVIDRYSLTLLPPA